MIQFLDENQILPNVKSYREYFKESIKCYHSDFALYFEDLIKQNTSLNFSKIEICYGFQF